MQKFSSSALKEGKTIGFVPTMGYLHEGHLSLVKKSKSICNLTVVSIFINPTQFGVNEDLSRYPRDLERDKKMLNNLGIDALFFPREEEIYPEDFQTYIVPGELSHFFEGASRPGHFKGVATVVAMLFNCVKPNYAIFGQKDAQQAAIIKRMTKDLKFSVKIIVEPTVREPDGLAMSSRNSYLSPKERKDSLVLFKSLKIAEEMIKSGVINVGAIIHEMKKEIDSADTSELDYIAVVDYDTLKPINVLEKDNEYLVLIACKIGQTRLIDNIIVKV